MRITSAVLAVLALAACGDADESATPPRPEVLPPPTEPPPNTPAAASERLLPGPPPRVALAPDGFAGRWAVSAELCDRGAWVFTPTALVTAGEVSCTFDEVETTADGWALRGACRAEAPPAPAALALTPVDPASPDTMSVSGGPFAPVTLQRCETED
jgi:hypothetical protein